MLSTINVFINCHILKFANVLCCHLSTFHLMNIFNLRNKSIYVLSSNNVVKITIFTISYLIKTAFSTMESIKTSFHSIITFCIHQVTSSDTIECVPIQKLYQHPQCYCCMFLLNTWGKRLIVGSIVDSLSMIRLSERTCITIRLFYPVC